MVIAVQYVGSLVFRGRKAHINIKAPTYNVFENPFLSCLSINERYLYMVFSALLFRAMVSFLG